MPSRTYHYMKNGNIEWPTLRGRERDFLEHEWMRHGSCSGMQPFQFFNSTLHAHESYDILKALDGKTRSPQNIKATMQERYGLTAKVRHGEFGQEVWTCLDRALRPLPCNLNELERIMLQQKPIGQTAVDSPSLLQPRP